MKASFLVPIVNNSPLWPAFGDDPAIDGFGIGGCAIIGQAPQATTCLALIEAAPTIMAGIKADSRWQLVEDLP